MVITTLGAGGMVVIPLGTFTLIMLVGLARIVIFRRVGSNLTVGLRIRILRVIIPLV